MKNKTYPTLLASALVAMVGLVGCSSPQEVEEAQGEEATTQMETVAEKDNARWERLAALIAEDVSFDEDEFTLIQSHLLAMRQEDAFALPAGYYAKDSGYGFTLPFSEDRLEYLALAEPFMNGETLTEEEEARLNTLSESLADENESIALVYPTLVALMTFEVHRLYPDELLEDIFEQVYELSSGAMMAQAFSDLLGEDADLSFLDQLYIGFVNESGEGELLGRLVFDSSASAEQASQTMEISFLEPDDAMREAFASLLID